MAKDGVVSIAIDYKNELNQMIRDYESALTEMASSDKLSKGMKAQFDNTIAELKRFKADMEKSFSDLSIGKVDKNSFKAFKQTVNKKIESVRAEIDNLNLAVSTINSQIKILGGDLDISKISSQFKDFQDYVQNTNNAIDTMIKKLDGQGISLMSFDQSSINSAIDGVKKIEKAIKDLDSNSHEKYDITILDMNEEEIQNEANSISATIEHLRDRMDSLKKDMENPYTGGIQLTKIKGEYEALSLEMKKAYDKMEDILDNEDLKFTPVFSKSALGIEELDEYDDDIEKFIKRAKLAKQELQAIINSAKQSSAKISDKLNPNSAELVTGVTIETTSSELWKKLSPILEDLQNDLNKNPVVAPVKLVVAPNAVSSEKNDEVGTISKSYSKKYQRELAKTGEDAVIDLEGVYKKTFTSIMDEAVSYSKETISKIQNIFESSPIKLYFDFNEEEFKKLSNVLLSSDSGKKIDITGQIAESKKEVNELADKLAEVNELLNSADSKDFSFKGFDKFAEEISKSLNQLTELQSMLKTLQNIESTLARASGVSSVTDIETQWQNVSKLIENSIKLDGTFRKNTNVDKLATEYNKYLNMGGTNELSSIGKIEKLEDNKNIIDAILSKVKELNSQKVDTSSVDKADNELKSVSSTLDDVISRLDHMINLTRDIGNTFWKMFKDASVSDVDKQWSSIESKFKSIADESGKINLSKQKKDIQELVEMYQKYANAGGMKTPFDLTNNTETIKKMNKVYEQMNSKKNGTSVGSESKEFSKIEGSVNSLTSAINTKTESIKTEANTMELAARAEVKSIQKIIDALNPLIEKIENIPELKIPKKDATLPSKESNISSASTPAIEQQIKSESELNAEIEKRENIIRELQQLQEKLTVHEDFHGNDRYFADQLPTEEEIREADKRIKQLTGTNNIFDVDKLIQDRNEWLSEVKYSLEEYDDLIKANDQKALDEYTTRGLSRIGGAESFFGYEDNNFSIASKFVEEKEKIQNEINDLYVDLDKLDEKMNFDSNNSSVDNTVQSQEKLQSELKETQEQAEKTAQAIKEVASATTSTEQKKDAFPTQSFDNEMQQNLVMLENYKNTVEEIDKLKLEPDTKETKDKIEELNKLADYFVSRITVIRGENGHDISSSMMKFSGLWNEQLKKYPSDKAKELYQLASDKSGLQINSVAKEFSGIESEITNIETKSEGLRKSLTQAMQDSTSYVKSLRYSLTTIASSEEELRTEKNPKWIELLNKDIDNAISKFPELEKFKNKFSNEGQALDFIKSDSWNDFLSTLPQAKEYLQSIGYNFEKINSENSSTNTKPEIEGMEQIEKATEEAVQAKKEFATANEGVQSSIDDSENPLKLEAELMEQIAKSAREAADAKKEFVEANKQVKASVDDSNSENKKKDKYAKHNKISEDDFLNNSNKYSLIANEKLSNSGYTILGGTVNSDLIDGLVKVSAKIKDIDENWKTFSARIDADGNIFSQRFRTITKGVNNLDNELANFGKDKIKVPETDEQVQKFKELNIAINDYASVRKRMANDKAFDNDEEDSQKLLKTINEIMGKADGSATILSSKQLSDAQDKLDEIDKTISDIQQKNAQKVNNSLLKIQNDATEKLFKYTDSSKYTPEFIGRVNSKITEISKLEITEPKDVARLKTIDSEVQKIVDDSKLLENKLVKQDSKIADIISQMKIFRSQNTNMSSLQKQNLDSIIKYAEELKNTGKVTAQEIEKIKISFSGLKADVASTGNMGKNFFSQIGSRLTDMNSKFVAQFLSWQDWIRYLQQAASIVIDLNTQITELAKVSEQTSKQIYNDFDSYADIAKEVRGTISDTIAATADWSKNGYSIPDAKQLAKVSQLYKNVGDGINIDEANESLISTLKGFQLEADQAEHIVDVFNEVSNNESISSGGIGEALQRSAASFNAANTSLEKSVALVTATNSVLQDPEKAGNMWKTVSARLRGSETELSQMGEDTDGLVKSTSKLQKLVKGITGFDIMQDKDTYKDIYDIILGIGEKWQDLSDIDRASLLEALAGKNQSNALAAALSNIDVLKKSYEEATNAEGSAREENEEYAKSIQASIDLAKAKLEELANDFLSSDFLKGLIDTGGTALDIVNKIFNGLQQISSWGGNISSLGGILGTVGGLVQSLTGHGEIVLRPSL